jgi:ABC-type lipoprotein export system ATPase subunit
MESSIQTKSGHGNLPTTASPPAAYKLDHVTKAYGGGGARVTALREVTLTIAPGESVAIVGASGSGKTTLLQLLGALDRPTTGSLTCLGQQWSQMSERDLTRLRRDSIGFVFQQFNLIPTLTARQNIESKLIVGTARSDPDELLASVGLGDRVGHLPSQLSGGEQQRVAIARALATRPPILLADEPTGNLDSTTGQEIIELLRRLSVEHGHTVILVTHDRSVAQSMARVIELRDGAIISDHPGQGRGAAVPA